MYSFLMALTPLLRIPVTNSSTFLLIAFFVDSVASLNVARVFAALDDSSEFLASRSDSILALEEYKYFPSFSMFWFQHLNACVCDETA
ncbi:hypothetical protein WR25_19225 [Diploscapter pachys]|uniref:Uncharacterized protein n=1 Tax=Diploscapter pachys TaxID=2018661 RepID=A0A2A2KWP5_9BILA|nr:hypothetical protein WR25_19225 [Diploscapter pachys]